MSDAREIPAPEAADARPRNVDAARLRSARSRRIAWALAAVVALLYALAFVMNR
jgi:hypothetical protein